MFPTPLSAYPVRPGEGLLAILAERIALDPFNAVATAIFFLAIAHTFAAASFARLAARVQDRHVERQRTAGLAAQPSLVAETLRFFGEVEVVFGLWAVVLVGAIVTMRGWDTARHYINDTVSYTEALFVGVIMTLASTRP